MKGSFVCSEQRPSFIGRCCCTVFGVGGESVVAVFFPRFWRPRGVPGGDFEYLFTFDDACKRVDDSSEVQVLGLGFVWLFLLSVWEFDYDEYALPCRVNRCLSLVEGASDVVYASSQGKLRPGTPAPMASHTTNAIKFKAAPKA